MTDIATSVMRQTATISQAFRWVSSLPDARSGVQPSNSAQPSPSFNRACGECSACCKLLRICKREDGGPEDCPFSKPPGEWCKHCAPGHGCRIYATPEFPRLCGSYECLWKLGGLPDYARPDKIHAIFGLPEQQPEFPGETVIGVSLDLDGHQVNPRFLEWLANGACWGLRFVFNRSSVNESELRKMNR